VPSLSDWRAPSDILLETPGIEILRGIPALETGLPRDVEVRGTESSHPSSERRLES
jgi:hypothetical protein